MLVDVNILDLMKSFQEDELRKAQEELTQKAIDVLTRNKNVPPEHQYSHKEGTDDRPTYYYTDDAGNYYKYTNAPAGHSDVSSMYGEAELHTSEPTFETNPEYFTPEGKKLTRCPDCDPAQVEWNQTYNRYDPQNMWAGRWMKDDGSYCYTYLDSDIREFPRFHIHQQNAIVDVQLPALRQMVTDLYNSDRLKDQLTGLAIALLDQGRIRASELCCLKPDDISFDGNLVMLGTRRIYADGDVLAALETLKQHKAGDEPLFAVPLQDMNGELDTSLQRRIGPNYLSSVVEQLGISLLGLQTYHATLRFYQEVKRVIERYQAPWDMAVQHALLSAVLEWGHDFSSEVDAGRVMQLTQAVLIDPIIIDALKQSAQEAGLLTEYPVMELPPPYIPIPYVSLNMLDRTAPEAEFSQWIHSVPIHEYYE